MFDLSFMLEFEGVCLCFKNLISVRGVIIGFEVVECRGDEDVVC